MRPLLLMCVLGFVTSWPAFADRLPPDAAYLESIRREKDDYPTAAEARKQAHTKFDDFKNRLALVCEADPIPGSKLTSYRLWVPAVWTKDKKNRPTMATPLAEEWFYWQETYGKRLVKGNQYYVQVADSPQKGADKNKYQAYLRFYTSKEWVTEQKLRRP